MTEWYMLEYPSISSKTNLMNLFPRSCHPSLLSRLSRSIGQAQRDRSVGP